MRAAIVSFLLAVCLAVVVSGCGGGSSSTTTTQPTTVASPTTTTTAISAPVGHPRTDLQSIFEDEPVLYDDYAAHPGSVARSFATFKALGVQRLRVFVPWNLLAPDAFSYAKPKVSLTQIDSYTLSYWEYLDVIVRQAKTSGIGLVFDVGAPAPYWALGKHPQTALYNAAWKPDAAAFGDLMKVLGERYSGTYTPSGASSVLPRVSFWSIWNEPNAVYLTPDAVGPKQTPYSAHLYRGIVDAAWQGLASSGHTPKTDTILIGETAPRGVNHPGNSSGVVPLTFIRAMYCVSGSYKPLTGTAATTLSCPSSGSASSFRAANPGLFEASGWADHPYSDMSAPNVKLPGNAGANDADFASLSNLASALDGVQKAYGSSTQLPIYSTEYGYKTNPPTSLGLPNKQAAAYMNQAEYLSWLNPRIRSYSQYLLIDVKGNDFDTGLESPVGKSGGTPKPDTYDAYRMPLWLPTTTATKQTPLTVWGCARPVNDAGVSSAKVAIQFAIGASSSYTTVKTVTLDPSTGGCYFSTTVPFDASGSVRLSYDDDGTVITSRTQSITLH